MGEAKLVGEVGQVPDGDGWFVVNVREARWRENAKFGFGCSFEGDHPFPQLGINVRLIAPGQPACKYHRENQQEAFLVLSGECTLLIDGQERHLSAWDFVHCPPGVDHVFVGRGAGPCAILMMGARLDEEQLTYPVSELARTHGASAEKETHLPAEAYAGTPPSKFVPSPWPLQG